MRMLPFLDWLLREADAEIKSGKPRVYWGVIPVKAKESEADCTVGIFRQQCRWDKACANPVENPQRRDCPF